MSLRILHICKVYLPIRGGVQKVVSAMASLTSQYEHRVLTTGEDGAVKRQTLNGNEVIRCRSYLEIASMPMAPSLLNEARHQAKNSDLIALHYPFPLADLALATVLRLPPCVVFWHSNIVAQKKLKWLTFPLIYLTLSRATRIVVTSSRMIHNSRLLKRFEQKVTVIPYGLPSIEVERQTQTQTQTSSVSRDYFILIGRHVSYKGINVAIRAMRSVDSRLIVVGDGPLFEQHKLLAETLGVADKVEFFTNVDDDDLVRLLQPSLALILPSIMPNEAFALVQLEAMRLGKPVINTWLPSTVPDIARDQKEGLTVSPGDSVELAEAMQRLLSDKHWAREMGERARQRFNDHFTEQHFKRSLDAFFAELLTRGS